MYDIELPLDFVPSNNDGEVEEFELMPASRVLDLICDPQFKMTSAPVTIDFLIRKGIITLETGEELFIYFLLFLTQNFQKKRHIFRFLKIHTFFWKCTFYDFFPKFTLNF